MHTHLSSLRSYFLFLLGDEDEGEGGSGPSLYDLNMWSSEMETATLTVGH